MVILDTNILIDHLRRPDKESSWIEKLSLQYPQETFAVSLLTVQELYQGKSTKDYAEDVLVAGLLGSMQVLFYTYDIAKRAGEITRDSKQNVAFADAGIAATAIEHKCPLSTLNKKDFQDTPGLILL